MKLRDDIDLLRYKHGSDRAVALFNYKLMRLEKKAQKLHNMAKFKALYENRKAIKGL